MRNLGIISFAMLLLMASVVQAQLQISGDQQLMLQAAKKMMQHDYQSADMLYSQAIAANGNNIEAYLQRAMARRETGDANGMQDDASRVIAMANASLQQNPNQPLVYAQRGNGFRLLKHFPEAIQDFKTAIRLGGGGTLQNDLSAIEFEAKAEQ